MKCRIVAAIFAGIFIVVFSPVVWTTLYHAVKQTGIPPTVSVAFGISFGMLGTLQGLVGMMVVAAAIRAHDQHKAAETKPHD